MVLKYLKRKTSTIIPADDVHWIKDEKAGWSACSETCAGGMPTATLALEAVNKRGAINFH